MGNHNKLSDLCIILVVRLDTIERLENILFVTKYLTTLLTTSVTVVESYSYNNGLLVNLLDKKIQYIFHEDHDPILFRTKLLNEILEKAKTSFVSIWDTDVIVPTSQIVKAIELLRNREADFVYPYEKYFLDTSPILRKMFLRNPEIEFLEQNIKKMKEMYPPNPLGGAFLANLKSYKESGLENESFYGWGMEDGERFYRWENMGYKIKRVPGPLFHLSHPRGQNSNFHDVDQHFLKKKEVISVKRNRLFKENALGQ